MSFSIKRLLPHILVLIGFVVISLTYFNPVLKGKKIFQSDIMHHIGMAQQQKEHLNTEKEQTYWTNSAFGGMPTYLLGARYPNNFIKKLDLSIRFLPRPADYMFLYLLGFYLLLLALNMQYKLAALGAVAFGFSTYLIIILGVGHNSKAHAIAYMPIVLAGIILTFRKKYIIGFALTTLALGLQIVANHFQMTYYLLITVLILGLVYCIDYYIRGDFKSIFKPLLILLVAATLSVGFNATSMLATKDYVNESTRGKSPLTINPDGSTKDKGTGLSRDYITQYSYGISETFNLLIPNFMGGGTYEDLGKDSETYKAYINLGASPIEAINAVKQSPTYWGDQPIIEGPAYIGAVIIFLFVLSLFLINGRLKWWLVSSIVLCLLLSYGKNLAPLTDFFIDYVPLYNKFRAVSSIQVILEICIPLLAIVGLSKIFSDDITQSVKEKALFKSLIITAGIVLFFILFKSTIFDFQGIRDPQYANAYGQNFVNALIEDRKTLFNNDALRTLLFIFSASLLLYVFIKKKLSQNILIVSFLFLIIIDLVGVGRRYVAEDSFVSALSVDKPYNLTTADRTILKDKSHFRVLDKSSSSENMPAKASYFHNSLMGYHAAKPGRYNELLDFYIYEGNMNVINMLNTKYVIIDERESKTTTAYTNEEANGNAWFVSKIKKIENDDLLVLSLDTLDNKNTAVIPKSFSKQLKNIYFKDSTSTVKLIDYKSDYLKYSSSNREKGFAVFSEIYYKNGWNAYIDNVKVDHYRVNYILRGLEIPAGNHEIEFKFEPKLVETGSKISLASSGLFLLIFFLGIFFDFRNRKSKSSN